MGRLWGQQGVDWGGGISNVTRRVTCTLLSTCFIQVQDDHFGYLKFFFLRFSPPFVLVWGAMWRDVGYGTVGFFIGSILFRYGVYRFFIGFLDSGWLLALLAVGSFDPFS